MTTSNTFWTAFYKNKKVLFRKVHFAKKQNLLMRK